MQERRKVVREGRREGGMRGYKKKRTWVEESMKSKGKEKKKNKREEGRTEGKKGRL